MAVCNHILLEVTLASLACKSEMKHAAMDEFLESIILDSVSNDLGHICKEGWPMYIICRVSETLNLR